MNQITEAPMAQSEWQLILQIFGISTPLLVLMGVVLSKFLMKYLNAKITDSVRAEYQIEIESFKKQKEREATEHLKELDTKAAEHLKELEKKAAEDLKELEEKATEHQIQYSKLHIDRSEILKEIFSLLIDAERSLEDLATLFQSHEDIMDRGREGSAMNAHDELIDKIKGNRIYFEREFLDQLEGLMKRHKEVIVEASLIRDQLRQESGLPRSHRGTGNPLGEWRKLRDKVEGEIVEAREKVEDQFRSILGVK